VAVSIGRSEVNMAAGTPVLWQIKISHYNEKARWALDYKSVPHRRRSPLPLFGTLPTAWVLTRGTTFPILRLDGRSIGDSTRIIAALEERFPEPPLYPADRAERDRALALEDFFDEQLAPYVRPSLGPAATWSVMPSASPI
jgi:glutathione S-transferase